MYTQFELATSVPATAELTGFQQKRPHLKPPRCAGFPPNTGPDRKKKGQVFGIRCVLVFGMESGCICNIYLNALAATIPYGQWFAITAYIYVYSIIDIPRVKGRIYKKHNGYKLSL